MPDFILASASPRRSELLKQLKIAHRICSADIDETLLHNECPVDYVMRVATAKAQHIKQQYQEAVVLAADTSVVLGNTIMGKPSNFTDALLMLSGLSGKTHEVYSSVILLGKQQQQVLSVSKVTFRELSEQEIRRYWQTAEPVDKAGAYAVQGLASIFIEKIEGSFSGIMGLPLFETSQLLANEGIYVFNE